MPSPTASPGRRALLRTGALVSVAGGVALAPSPASAGRYRPRTYAKRPLLDKRDRHLVSRFSYGVTPELAKEVRRKGGARAWFAWQLSPSKVSDRTHARTAGWWPQLNHGPLTLWRNHADGIRGGWLVMEDYQRWVMARRMHSRRQVQEIGVRVSIGKPGPAPDGTQAFGMIVEVRDPAQEEELNRAGAAYPKGAA